jgi:hypothetical protein
MKRYDPRFLLILGQTREWRGYKMQDAQKLLIAVDVLLRQFLVENEDHQAQWGLNEITISAARQVLTYVIPGLNDSEFPYSEDAFNAWKHIFLLALDHFESALSVDIEAQTIVLLEEKLGCSVKVLMTDIEQTLPSDDRGLISDFAHDNMQEAGRCLVFERYTACGYHMARAVEDVARRYNYAVTGHESPYQDKNGEARHRPLAQIAAELQQVLDNWKHLVDPRLLSLIVPTLRNFCRIYRNPLSHADPDLKELGPNDAEIAFRHATSGISTMLEDGRMGGPHFHHPCIWR